MYNSNTDSLGLILGVEVFFSLGHCSGALCILSNTIKETICVCVRSVSSSSVCLSPPQLQITGVGVVCRGWTVGHGRGRDSEVLFP